MNPLKAIKKLGVGIVHSSRRFPITLFSSITVAILLIILSELRMNTSVHTLETLSKVTMVFALGIPFSLCARVYYERRQEKNLSKLILYYFIGVCIGVFYYFILLNDLNKITTTRFIGINIVFYLVFLFIPYAIHGKNFEMYVINLFISFLTTWIYSMVLFIGLSAILFTVHHLLTIELYNNIYYHTFLLVSLVFAPGYFLSYVPKRHTEDSQINYPKALKVLILYIVMPLLSIYTFILYLYFGRIIISTTWPEGLVSHLVLWYSLVLTIVLFFINPIKDQSRWSLTFSKWAPRIILPLLFMMFISMGIRINAYGVTENRYYVIALGIWVLGTMFYLSLSKKRKYIFLPISLSIIVLLSVLGPISSYSISQYSQNKRLESILIQNNMLNKGEIRPSPGDISMENKQSISSILHYFNTNHGLHSIEFLPEDFEIDDMEETFGFGYITPYEYENKYFYYAIEWNAKIFDISEYDYLFELKGFYENPIIEDNPLAINIDHKDNMVRIKYNDHIIFEKDLSEVAQYLNENHSFDEKNSLPVDDMTFVEENGDYKLQFILQNMNGEKNEDGSITIHDASFYLFIKVK